MGSRKAVTIVISAVAFLVFASVMYAVAQALWPGEIPIILVVVAGAAFLGIHAFGRGLRHWRE